MWQSLGWRFGQNRTVAASATGAGQCPAVTAPVAEAATVRSWTAYSIAHPRLCHIIKKNYTDGCALMGNGENGSSMSATGAEVCRGATQRGGRGPGPVAAGGCGASGRGTTWRGRMPCRPAGADAAVRLPVPRTLLLLSPRTTDELFAIIQATRPPRLSAARRDAHFSAVF